MAILTFSYSDVENSLSVPLNNQFQSFCKNNFWLNLEFIKHGH